MMAENPTRFVPQRFRGAPLRALFTVGVLAAGACAAATGLPAPRSLINRSGARLQADPARMEVIDIWVRAQNENITVDPSFMIIATPATSETYPWDGLTVSGDTASVIFQQSAPDAAGILQLYGHFHLMKKMGRLDEFLPEGVDAEGRELEGYELEKAILSRVSDAWLYGRSLFDMSPYAPLDELMYAKENGYLEAFILTARPQEFREERRAWLDSAADASDRYRRWFQRTFEREPPGMR